MMAGPRDEELEVLRERYGYKPEATIEAGRSRLEWEQEFVGLLTEAPPTDPAELRVWIQAREVLHENRELLVGVLKEYAFPIRHLSGGFGADDPERSREFISGFFDALPSVRVAVDLKFAVHRNNQRGWAQKRRLRHGCNVDCSALLRRCCGRQSRRRCLAPREGGRAPRDSDYGQARGSRRSSSRDGPTRPDPS